MHITRMIAYFQRLLEHMFWADTAVLELLSADDDPSAGRLFAHLLAAERIWLLRLRGKDSTSQPVWPDLDVNGMRLLAQSNADEYARFLADLAEDGLQEEVAYATSRGAQFRNTVADIIGFYGRPWTPEERTATMRFLAGHGYRFYLYAPKADPYLRRRWQEPHPQDAAETLAAFAAACRDAGVRFGVGLSPYEIYRSFDDAARTALADKLQFLDDIGTDDVAILFDDMRGDLPGLAEVQAEIVHWAA
jgi:hypothetical protein